MHSTRCKLLVMARDYKPGGYSTSSMNREFAAASWECLLKSLAHASPQMMFRVVSKPGNDSPENMKHGQRIQESTLKDHLALHCGRLDDYDNLRRKVFDVYRSRQKLGGPIPMQLDSLQTGKDGGRAKARSGKGKSKDKGSKENKDKSMQQGKSQDRRNSNAVTDGAADGDGGGQTVS
eukprot:3554756-Amphidinium_carterae.1